MVQAAERRGLAGAVARLTEGFALAFPDGTRDSSGRRFWNATDACCNFENTPVDDVAYIPLHQQGLAWGKKDTVSVEQRADNQFMMYHVMKH